MNVINISGVSRLNIRIRNFFEYFSEFLDFLKRKYKKIR